MHGKTILRPQLHARLKKVFGRVNVYSCGRPIEWGLRVRDGRSERYFDKRNPQHHPGEYFAVDCPYCGDTKQRLWINHMWGVEDELTGSRNLWLAHCQRQGCIDRFEQQRALYSLVWADGPPCVDVLVRPSIAEERRFNGVEWPGAVWQLDSLPADHKARVFLEGRRFDPDWLSRQYRVGYIMEAKPRFHHLTGRLMIPIYFEGAMVGWQVRYVGDVPAGSDIPKYYTGEGTPRGRILYNFDLARQQSFACVVEGPTDAWRFGPEAVAVLGKPTPYQTQLLATAWRDKKVVVLLDPDAIRESGSLFQSLANAMTVVEIVLPDNMDPADFQSMDALRRHVFAEARKTGVELG